jgi:hypothetical protein
MAHQSDAQQQLKDDPCGTPVECYAQAYQALKDAEQKIPAIQAGLLDLNRTVITNKNLVLAYQKQVNESILRLKANVSANGQAISSNTHAIAMNKNVITASNNNISANSLWISTLKAYPCNCVTPEGICIHVDAVNTSNCCNLCISTADPLLPSVQSTVDIPENIVLSLAAETAIPLPPTVKHTIRKHSHQAGHALSLKGDTCSTPVECYEQAVKAHDEAEQKILGIQTGLSDLNHTVVASQNEALASQKQVNATILRLKANVSANGQAISNSASAITTNKDAIATSNKRISSNSQKLQVSKLRAYLCDCLPPNTPPKQGSNCTITGTATTAYCCQVCIGTAVDQMYSRRNSYGGGPV